MLVASGRQALNLIARQLRAEGITRVYAPSLNCPSMLLGFHLEAIFVHPLPVESNGQLDPHALRLALSRAVTPVAILHSLTFGSPTTATLAQVLADARERGHRVIVDASHAPLAVPERSGWDFAMASLRKLLPVPDGAWVEGLSHADLQPRGPLDDELVAARIAVLNAPPGSPQWLAATAVAEDLFDATPSPTAISALGRQLFEQLDLAQLAQARHRASAALRTAIQGTATTDAALERTVLSSTVLNGPARNGITLNVINPLATSGWVAVRTEQAQHLDAILASHHIYQPLDWAPDLLVLDAGLDEAAATRLGRLVAENVKHR